MDSEVTTQEDVAKARAKATTMTAFTVLCVVAFMTVSAFFTYSVWRHETARSDAAVDAGQESAELLRCSGTFATLLQERSYDHETAVGELLVEILETIQIPIEDRDDEPKVNELVAEVSRANELYREAVQMRIDWTEAGSPLPCPI